MTVLDPRQYPDPPRPHPPGTRFAVALLVGFAFALGFVAGTRAAPRADSLPSIPVADAGQLGAPLGQRAEPVGGEVTSEPVRAQPSGAPITEPPAIASGIASWYAASGLIAAVPGWRFGDRPYRVRVCHGDSCVVVTAQDWCGCPGGRIIDLSDDAFRRLAPLSVGVIVVTVEDVVGPGPGTPPPTDSK